jgi:hypothetical protein
MVFDKVVGAIAKPAKINTILNLRIMTKLGLLITSSKNPQNMNLTFFHEKKIFEIRQATGKLPATPVMKTMAH